MSTHDIVAVICLLFVLLPVCVPLMFLFYSIMKSDLLACARSEALREASEIARDFGDFELADTEGSSGQRLERAYIAHKIELEIRSRIKK